MVPRQRVRFFPVAGSPIRHEESLLQEKKRRSVLMTPYGRRHVAGVSNSPASMSPEAPETAEGNARALLGTKKQRAGRLSVAP
jgi:hypothetical protein